MGEVRVYDAPSELAGKWIREADHLAALRRAKAEVWREAEKDARLEASSSGNTGDYQLACRCLAEVYSARAAQIEEGGKQS